METRGRALDPAPAPPTLARVAHIPGVRDEPAVLGFQELLLQEVLLVQGLR